MSVETWFAEFMPVPAESAVSSDRAACEHALRKFTGLLPENLDKHKVEFVYLSAIRDHEITRIVTGSANCSLCHRYLAANCAGCPLYLCYTATGLYKAFTVTGNPQPLIDALKSILEKL